MLRKDLNKIEDKAINFNMFFVFLMGASGLIYGFLAHSSAIMLDGLFSTVLFLTVILAKIITRFANRPINDSYPQGRFLLENLYLLFKIIVLITILSFSIVSSFQELYHYFFNDFTPPIVDEYFANRYYIVKTFAFLSSYYIYTHFFEQTKKTSNILKLERKSVLIDGTITIAIFLGFLVLGNVAFLAPISDPIILLGISLFLLKEVYHDFTIELNNTIGRRNSRDREIYYRSLFNNYFADETVSDIYIHPVGKLVIVSITATFKGCKSVEEIQHFEKEIKRLMFDEYDEIYLYTYYNKRTVNLIRDFEIKK